jgi:hypothetical protein
MVSSIREAGMDRTPSRTSLRRAVVRVLLENRYQQLHVDTGSITPGPNGAVEVDVPLANLAGTTTGTRLQHPCAASYVREGVLAGPLEPIDSGGPFSDYVVGVC